jgi:hypothetical protein
MTQNIMTSALEVSGPKKYFFAFSILLDDLAHISAMFILKMKKSLKSAHSTGQWGGLLVVSVDRYMYSHYTYSRQIFIILKSSSYRKFNICMYSIAGFSFESAPHN